MTGAAARVVLIDTVFSFSKPQPPFGQFIELFWYWHEPPTGVVATTPAKERVLPTGTVELVIRLTENKNRVFDARDPKRCREFSGSVVTGTQTKFFVLDKREQDHLVGIHFRPGGAFPFFGLPAQELRNCHVSLEDLWGNRADHLRSDLLAAGTAIEKFSVLECYLNEASKARTFHPAVRYALAQFETGQPSSAALAQKVNLSQRRFIQLFNEQVGLTPKLYSRIQRFQAVVKLVQHKKRVDWLEVALSCGYFDQPHFIHDFKEFSGFSPATYLERHPDHSNHIALLDSDFV